MLLKAKVYTEPCHSDTFLDKEVVYHSYQWKPSHYQHWQSSKLMLNNKNMKNNVVGSIFYTAHMYYTSLYQ